MTLSTSKKNILSALLSIRDEGPRKTEIGICNNVMYQFDDYEKSIYQWLKDTYVGWSKYSGDIDYPVPSTISNLDPAQMYSEFDNIWVGEYGALRYELLDFLIAALVEEDRK